MREGCESGVGEKQRLRAELARVVERKEREAKGGGGEACGA